MKEYFRDPIVLDLMEASDRLKKENREEIESLEEEFDEYRERLREQLDDVRESLKKLEDYEDEKDRAVVNDVVENIVSKRLNQLDDLRYSEDPEEFQEELNEFTMDFTHMKRKEAAVMKAVPESIRLNENFEQLQNIKNEFDEFMENRYSLKTDINRIEELEERKKLLEEKINEKEAEIKEIDEEKVEDELESVRNELEDLDSTDVWQEYEELQDELEEARGTLVELENEEGKAVNKMERGLKKLIYRIEETDLEYNGDLKLLKTIRDGDKQEITDHDADRIKSSVKEALESLPEELLSDSQEQKFVEGVQTLGSIDELREKIIEEREKIDRLNDRINDHDALDRRKELQHRKEDVQEKLKEIRQKKKRLDKEIENHREELEDITGELKDKIRDSSDRTVEFTNKDEKDND